MRRFILFLAGACALAGCADLRSGVYRQYPENGWPELEHWAVLGIANESGEVHVLDGLPIETELTHHFAVELAKVRNLKVMHPEHVVSEMMRKNLHPEPLKGVEEILKLGRALGVDAVVIGTITTYDPYTPPRLGVALQVFRTKRRSVASSDIDALVQSGRPIPIERGDAGYVVASFERIYDAHHDATRDKLEAFGLAHSADDFGGNSPEWDAMNIRSRWFSFVSTDLIREVMKQGQMRPAKPVPQTAPVPEVQAAAPSKPPPF